MTTSGIEVALDRGVSGCLEGVKTSRVTKYLGIHGLPHTENTQQTLHMILFDDFKGPLRQTIPSPTLTNKGLI